MFKFHKSDVKVFSTNMCKSVLRSCFRHQLELFYQNDNLLNWIQPLPPPPTTDVQDRVITENNIKRLRALSFIIYSAPTLCATQNKQNHLRLRAI